MANLEKLLDQIKSAGNELKKSIWGIDDKISALQEERNSLTSGFVSKEDYLHYVGADMERKTELFSANLCREVMKRGIEYGHLERIKNTRENLLVPYLTGMHGVPAVITHDAILYYFGDIIKQRMGDALDSIDWPENAIPREERAKRIAEIDTDLSDLKAQRNALAQELQNAGMAG
jgi:chorismate mutase